MNANGNMGYMTLLNLIVIFMVFLFLISQANELDVDYLHDTMIVRNLGMTMTTISFLPGSFYYDYLTEDDKRMAEWDEVLSKISPNKIKYYKNDTKDHPYKNRFYSNNFLSYPFKSNKEIKIAKNSLNIFKQRSFHLDKKPDFKKESELKKINCQLPSESNLEREYYPLHCTHNDNFYDEEGDKIKEKPRIDYDGFQRKYFVDNQRVYKMQKGLKHSTTKESEEIWRIVKLIHPQKNKDKCIPTRFLSNETILLTLNNKGGENEDSDYIIARVPEENYSKKSKIACGLINKMLRKDIILKEVEGVNVLPTRKDHIILELGSIKGSLIKYKTDIAEALQK